MRANYFILDVFAENKYQGNQLAVFTDLKNISDSEMQHIAREMNF
jgi:trans-2,3-dihydro-3-hydroxyanthranilate isomerase